ncbi:pyroglutamyl-peptidase I [Paenarthrobacter ureafaciens]|jgi:pyroglutamyl-peptidase|uniref:pyroglutamyl-peptidase I n=1 Tax=Paenarthrobacter ureafaciens TaxID=37931 RepID=UPI0019174004|nr:pyroglutamyl-peptidase I [Paenarthrobacter ureafaciens]QQQ63736.1 pyroglutamyl-peptidase I [Paenarthrobacter ureafaciens]
MILLTGFEPFGGDFVNPSWPAVGGAAALLRGDGLDVETLELPCVFGESARVLEETIDAIHPRIVVAVGLAGGRSRMSLERVAINVDDARIPDNQGNRPIDQDIVQGGPAAYFTTLPIKAALRNLQIEGIRAEVSQTAGTYVCNHVFYSLMKTAAGKTGIRAGFIHVPYLPEQVPPGSSVPTMVLDDMVRGISVVVRTALQTTVDEQFAAGAIH